MTSASTLHATARDFAIKHGLTLGRKESGYYYLRHPVTLAETHVSLEPTAKSALAMMGRALRVGPGDRVVLALWPSMTVPPIDTSHMSVDYCGSCGARVYP